MDIKPKRRWFRYSLRTLLVFVTVASAGFGWLGIKVRAKQREREFIKTIRNAGGQIKYDYQVGVPINSSTPPGPAWLRKLLGDDFFANVYVVHFDQEVNEAQLVHLEGLRQLRHLYLGNLQVTDAGLACLQRLTRLKNLQTFRCTQVTDAGLVHLQGLSDLESLELGNAHISDAGLLYLEGLTRLKSLDLRKTQITDAGLVHLQGLSDLELLDVGDTQVTEEGCKELQKALPNLRMYR